MVEAVNFGDGLLFAAEATKAAGNSSRSKKFDKAELQQRQDFREEDDVEFDWQRTDKEGRPPPRKRMLCYTMRRLFRTRIDSSFRSLEEQSELFTGAHRDLKNKGMQDFQADMMSADVKKQQQRQLMRKIFVQLQLRYN